MTPLALLKLVVLSPRRRNRRRSWAESRTPCQIAVILATAKVSPAVEGRAIKVPGGVGDQTAKRNSPFVPLKLASVIGVWHSRPAIVHELEHRAVIVRPATLPLVSCRRGPRRRRLSRPPDGNPR